MIGIFDSGLGGLTALRDVARLLPEEDIVYFGDTGRVPYGTRSPQTIIKYSEQDLRFLLSFGVDCILVACGTASSTAIEALRKMTSIPVVGVILPTVKAAVAATENRHIGVIGTAATIRNGAFSRSISEYGGDIDVISTPCPLFVPLVENGFAARGDEITLAAAHRYLDHFRSDGIDTLVLGCTHYPLIEWAISEVLPEVKLISSGSAAAGEIAGLIKSGAIKTRPGNGDIRCFVSDKPDGFDASAGLFMGGVDIGHAEIVDIDKY